MKKNSLQTAVMPEIEPGVIRTFTGKMINVFDPDPKLICIEDIAHALSNLCRFGGHTRLFYSVAEHSLRVAEVVPHKHRIAGLLHDASEAYLVDIPSPIKYFIPKYKEYEQNMMLAIAEKLGFDYPLHSEVVRADRQLLEVEWGEMIQPEPIIKFQPMRPNEAAVRFLNYFEFQTLNY